MCNQAGLCAAIQLRCVTHLYSIIYCALRGRRAMLPSMFIRLSSVKLLDQPVPVVLLTAFTL